MVEKLCDIEELHETEKLLAELGDQVNSDQQKEKAKLNKVDKTTITKQINTD